MMMSRTMRVWLSVMILLGGLVGAKATYDRVRVEQTLKTVSVCVPLKELQHLGAVGGAANWDAFSMTVQQQTGLKTILVDEAMLSDLVAHGKATAYMGAELINMSRVGASAGDRFRPDRLYVWLSDRSTYDLVNSGLITQLGHQAVIEKVPGITLEIAGNWEMVKDLGLGIDPQLVADLARKGWGVIARLQPNLRLDRGALTQKCHQLATLPGVKLVIFEGPMILGGPGQVAVVADQLRLYGLHYGQVEFFPQQEFDNLVAHYPAGLIKVHSITELEREKMTATTALRRYVRAVQDRGIRVLVVHPQWKTPAVGGLYSGNVGFIRALTKTLEAKGYRQGLVATPFPAKMGVFSVWELVLLGLALGSFGLWLWSFVRPLSWWGIGSVAVAVVGSLALFPLETYRWIWGFLGVMVLPAGVILGILDLHPQRFWVGFMAGTGYLILGLLTILGVFFSPVWLSGAMVFHGVRLALLFPLVLVWAVLFVQPHRLVHGAYLVKRWLNTPIRVGVVVALGVIALGVGYYVLRSGNAASVMGKEMGARETLEMVFGVRPRTKEILGFMFLFCGFWWQHKPWSRWLLVMGTVGVISVVNSFCHFHTPLWVSAYRSLLGIALGYGLAVLVVMGRRILQLGVTWWTQAR